jgi:probable F420-dependent oxidoreductase
MRLGVNILNFGPGATANNLGRWARMVEALGYHFVMISDHLVVTPDVDSQYPAPFFDPFIALAWVAGVTSKVEIGTTVAILPYRHPLHTARMAADIDQLSDGRFILGAGVGWAKQEFGVLGVDFARRGALTNEYLEAIKQFWTCDVVSYRGVDVYTAPRPVRSPHPPIWVGGSSEAAMRRAVRYGDGWHPIRFGMNWLRDEALPTLCRIAEEEKLPVPALCPRLKLDSVDQAQRDVAALEKLGATHVLLDTYTGNPQDTATPERDWAKLAALIR